MLTRKHSLWGIKQVKGVVHELARGCHSVTPQFVLHYEGIVAIVKVGGLVEKQTSMFDGAVV